MIKAIQNRSDWDLGVSNNALLLVDFFATWCGPCRMLAPTIETLAQNNQDWLNVWKVDVDQHPDLAQQYQISSIPSLFLFKNGQVVASRVGGSDLATLQAWVDNHH